MRLLSGALYDDVTANVIAGIIVAGLLAAAAWLWRKRGLPYWRKRRDKRELEKFAPEYLVIGLSYATHLRDVMGTFWRAHEDPPERVRERIRRDILEPIRAFIPTLAGEEIKVVWFRPDLGGTALCMCEQVGHTAEGQAGMRLPVGAGLAGRAYTPGDYVYSRDVDNDDRFHAVDKGSATGSIACAPIKRAGMTTGVLSVMSTCKDAFWVSEQRYFEALAAAIAGIETLEQHGKPKP